MQGAFTSFFGPAGDARETKGLTTALNTRDTEAGGSGLIRPVVGQKSSGRPEGVSALAAPRDQRDKQRGPDVTRDNGLSSVQGTPDAEVRPAEIALANSLKSGSGINRPPESITVFVDRLFRMPSKNPQAHFVGRKNGHRWCHMWCEDVEMLHGMAAEIGMKRAWFQAASAGAPFPHYDLTPRKRLQALRRGAVEMDLREWLRERVLNHSVKTEGGMHG